MPTADVFGTCSHRRVVFVCVVLIAYCALCVMCCVSTDDVAFFFVLYAVVGLAVVPITSYWALSWLSTKLFASKTDAPADVAPARPGEAAAAGASAIVRHIVRTAPYPSRRCIGVNLWLCVAVCCCVLLCVCRT